VVNKHSVFGRRGHCEGVGAISTGFDGFALMAKKDGIKIVKSALEKGFTSRGAKLSYFRAEKSDYKDFIRMYVISDFFRRKTEKERLGEIFSMLEENGAKTFVAKISLCVAMTKREYDKEFGPDVFLGIDLHRTYREMKSRPRLHKPLRVQRAS